MRGPGKPRRPLAVRFAEKYRVDEASGCWVWTGNKNANGYGVIAGDEGRYRHQRRAHRVSWELLHGPLDKSVFVCHRCDNPPCVNPDHLFIGGPAENQADRVQKGRTTRGDKHPQAKLTALDVRKIRMVAQLGIPQHMIAKVFSVSRTNISAIIGGRSWKS